MIEFDEFSVAGNSVFNTLDVISINKYLSTRYGTESLEGGSSSGQRNEDESPSSRPVDPAPL